METNQEISSVSGEEVESPTSTRTPQGWHKYWDREMRAFLKRARKFRKNGNLVVDRFVDEGVRIQQGSNDFRVNLFHSNISMMQSMLYGSTPKIDVSREHQDPDDDVARVASVLLKRMLEVNIASSGEGLSSVLKEALQDRLLPGLGTCRVYYEAVTEEDAFSYEEAIEEYVHWQDFAWGWARIWKDVPWVAYRSWMTKDEVEARFNDTIADALTYEEQQVEEKDTEAANDNETAEKVEKAQIWEIWDKETMSVYWYSSGAELILDIKEDPYKLDGFFPSPMPMMANLTTRQVMPKADFLLAQDLYNEVDILQTRIAMITKAVKVVGVYDKSSDGIKRMLGEGTENDLIPVDNWAMFAEKGGIAGQIDWMPIEEIAGVLDKLRQQQNESKALLFEVTGLSDLLRGANTDQYTSDGTNQLTAKFGSIRVQALQDDFARFASDLESLKAELISKHFSPPTIFKYSSAQFLPMADKMQVGPAIQLLTSPAAKWRINIKPESIAMVDYAQLKAERTEYLTSVATFLQSAGALIQQMPGATPVLLEMLKWGMAGFKGADYLEGTLDKAIEQASKAPPPGQGEQQAQAQAEQQKMQMELQIEMQKAQAKLQAEMQVIQAKAQSEIEKSNLDHQHKMQQQMAKSQGDMQKIMADLQADLRVIAAKLQAEERQQQVEAEGAAAELQVDHENQITQMEFEHLNTMQEIELDAEMEARQRNREADTD